MRIGKVIGQVTLSRCHPALVGFSWRVVVPMTEKDLQQNKPDRSIDRTLLQSEEHLVVLDPLAVNEGCVIGFSEGAEASMPFYPDNKPVDAYNAVLLDELVIAS